MSTAPIASNLENEQHFDYLTDRERGSTADQDVSVGRASIREIKPETGVQAGSADFMSDLLDSQQRLISAQHQFRYDGDMGVLARAQMEVIFVQNSVMQRMGVFG